MRESERTVHALNMFLIPRKIDATFFYSCVKTHFEFNRERENEKKKKK